MSSSEVIRFKCFTKEQVKEINKEINETIKKNTFQKEELSNAANASKTGDFYRVPCGPLMELLHPWLYKCQQVNKDVFGYDIYWNFHLEALNYNVYGTNNEYDWHVDANKENKPYDMKLTCLLNLSEESYEGGEFKIIGIDEKIKFDSGEGLIVNSLIAHKVTPVTKGERITLTYWAEGPVWR